MSSAPRRGGSAGFSLVELMVALSVFALVMVALTLILFSSTKLGSRT